MGDPRRGLFTVFFYPGIFFFCLSKNKTNRNFKHGIFFLSSNFSITLSGYLTSIKEKEQWWGVNFLLKKNCVWRGDVLCLRGGIYFPVGEFGLGATKGGIFCFTQLKFFKRKHPDFCPRGGTRSIAKSYRTKKGLKWALPSLHKGDWDLGRVFKFFA